MAKTNLDFNKLGALTEMFNTTQQEEKKDETVKTETKSEEGRGEEKIPEDNKPKKEDKEIVKKKPKTKVPEDDDFVEMVKEKALKYNYLQFSKSVVYLSDKTKKLVDLIAEITGLSSKTITDVCILEFVELNKDKLETAFRSYTEEKQKNVLDI